MQNLRKGAHRVVFVRHGESVWNQENRFTGWWDVPLTEKGKQEAKQAGQMIKEAGLTFDLGYTSVLKRAILTYNTIVDEIDHDYIPVSRSYRLNERHYGGLTGLNKAETVKKHGEEQVLKWRRSYSTPPPPMDIDDERHSRFDRKYRNLPLDVLPASESLQLTVKRVLPYWFDEIYPNVKKGNDILIVAHGNSLRAIVKYLSKMGDDEISGYNIPTGVPFVYEFDENMKPIGDLFYLLSEDEVKRRAEAVANQTKG